MGRNIGTDAATNDAKHLQLQLHPVSRHEAEVQNSGYLLTGLCIAPEKQQGWEMVSDLLRSFLPEPTAHQLSSKGKIGKLRPCVVFLPALPFEPLNNHQKSFKNLPVSTKLDTMKRFRNNFVHGVQHEVSTTANSVSLLVLLVPCSERAFKLWLGNNCDSSPVTSINIRESYSLFK